jgi:4-amino-4-deoxy-L-arabinose transferase-like glycosyltransferase
MDVLARLKTGSSNLLDNSYFQYGLLLFITLLGAILRFYKLGDWSFWIDEVFTINRAQVHYGTMDAVIANIPPARNWIPLSIIFIAGVLEIIGVSEWSARLIPAIVGVVSIPLLYFPTKRLFGWQAAVVAALLLAFSPWHIYWAQNARFYTSLLLLSTLAVFSFYYGIEKDRPAYLVLFYFLLYLASSERLFAFVFVLPVLICYLFCLWVLPLEKPKGFNWKMILLLLSPIIIFAFIEIYSFAASGSSIIQYTMSIFYGQVNTTPLRLTLSVIYRIGIPVFFLGLFGGFYTIMNKQRGSLFVFISAALPILLLLVLSTFMFTVDRYIFMVLPFWFILGALAIKELFSHTDGYAKLLPLGVFVVMIATSMSEVFLYYQYQNGNRPDWRGAFAKVQEEIEIGDLVATTRPELGDYYLNESVTYINGLDIDTIEKSSGRIWFVIDEESGWVKPVLKNWILRNTELIDVLEVYLPGKSLSIKIFLYDPIAANRKIRSIPIGFKTLINFRAAQGLH